MITSVFSLSGILDAIEHYFLSNKTFILMYHRILDPVDLHKRYVQPGMFASTASFEKQIAFLKCRFEVILLEDLVGKILNGEDLSRLCAITFDDGWRDNYTDAFPVLMKYRLPATIFLATGFVGTDRMFWPEEISYYLDQEIAKKGAFCDAPPPLIRFSAQISPYHRCTRETFLDRCIEVLKGYPPGDRDEILGYFRGMFKAAPCPRQMLSWEEAREMLASGLVRFGAHTVNHVILDQVSPQKARDEITKSRADIEHNLGCRVSTFAYPNGNYTGGVRKILTESGFSAAVTTRKGFLARGMSLMEIPRIAIHEDVSNTIPMFRSRILLRKF
jgi:peptidoglycan/xylan/chitin deacetylase (PgdA/CDA1 family)